MIVAKDNASNYNRLTSFEGSTTNETNSKSTKGSTHYLDDKIEFDVSGEDPSSKNRELKIYDAARSTTRS